MTSASTPNLDVSKQESEKLQDTIVPKKREVMRANEAVELLEPLFLSRTKTKQEIVDQIRDGHITAYALKRWSRENYNLDRILKKKVWGEPPEDELVEKSLLPRKLWINCVDVHQNCLNWDWIKGKYYLAEMNKDGSITTHFIKGLWFLRADVMSLKCKLIGVNKKLSRGGRPRKVEEWNEFWLEVIQFSQEGRLNIKQMKQKKNFKLLMHERIKELGIPLSEASMKKPLELVSQRFLEDDHWENPEIEVINLE